MWLPGKFEGRIERSEIGLSAVRIERSEIAREEKCILLKKNLSNVIETYIMYYGLICLREVQLNIRRKRHGSTEQCTMG